jgi:hypothetical protein
MKLALLNLFKGHTEVFGYLIEIFKEHDITYYYKDNDNIDLYGYINYFEKIYGCIGKKNVIEFEKNYQQYDIILFITMTVDVPAFIQNHRFVYGIIHCSSRKSPYINNYITLYHNQMENFKKIIKNKSFSYTYPFYNTPKFINKEYKYILYIGNQLDNDDDIINFKNNIKYELVFFNNINKDLHNKDMQELEKYLEKTVFILGKKTYYYNNSYSGSVTLSYSFNIPIILKKDKLEEYGIDGIGFEYNYSELINYVNNINFDDYDKLLNKMNEFKQNQIEKNKKFLLNLH